MPKRLIRIFGINLSHSLLSKFVCFCREFVKIKIILIVFHVLRHGTIREKVLLIHPLCIKSLLDISVKLSSIIQYAVCSTLHSHHLLPCWHIAFWLLIICLWLFYHCLRCDCILWCSRILWCLWLLWHSLRILPVVTKSINMKSVLNG